jgi:hypothetical protein
MATVFDLLTVTCFAGLVIAYFQFTNHDTRVLVLLLPAAIAFAVANQLGNNGGYILATILILAGVSYTVLVLRK